MAWASMPNSKVCLSSSDYYPTTICRCDMPCCFLLLDIGLINPDLPSLHTHHRSDSIRTGKKGASQKPYNLRILDRSLHHMAQSTRFLAAFFVGLSVLFLSVDAGYFINPPPGPCHAANVADGTVYNVGDRIELQWSTTLARMTIALWQGIEQTSNYNYQLPGACQSCVSAS